MKKLLLSVVLLASASVFAKEAKLVEDRPVIYNAGYMSEWTPFALTLVGPIGLPWGNWNVKGFQLGVFNSVYELSGLQLGLINVADRAYGVQIGVINVITSDDIPFLPIVNWNF